MKSCCSVFLPVFTKQGEIQFLLSMTLNEDEGAYRTDRTPKATGVENLQDQPGLCAKVAEYVLRRGCIDSY
jgi:hypothetical protein